MTYQLDNAWEHARTRLVALELIHDPATTRYLEALGVGPAEVGHSAPRVPEVLVAGVERDATRKEPRRQPEVERTVDVRPRQCAEEPGVRDGAELGRGVHDRGRRLGLGVELGR